jgi:hypothetical protein
MQIIRSVPLVDSNVCGTAAEGTVFAITCQFSSIVLTDGFQGGASEGR